MAEPERSPPATTAQAPGGVVWDLDPDALNVAFSRVRQVLEQPAERMRSTTAREIERPDKALAEEPVELPGIDGTDAGLPDYDDDWVDAGSIAMNLDDDEDARSSTIPYPRSEPRESPKSSWWRGLSFGLRRKVSMEAPQWEEPVDDNLDNLAYYGYQDDSQDDDLALQEVAWDDEELACAPAEPDHGWYDEPEPAMQAGTVAWDDDQSGLITSEDSWLEDELAFPEPQPAEWHDARTALFASSQVDEMIPASHPGTGVAPVTREPEWTVDQAVPPAEPRAPLPYFELEQETGMEAFRAALFGERALASRQPDPRVEPVPDRWSSDRAERPASREPEFSHGRDIAPPTRRESRSTRPERAFGLDKEFDIPISALDRDEAVPRFEVASRVGKSCQTCRSFQASEDRGRGRCGNPWAFTYRQMVNADDLPCHSSIGDWWLATDGAWFPPETVIRPETPYTDRLLARHDSQDEPEHNDDRRVRTRKAV